MEGGDRPPCPPPPPPGHGLPVQMQQQMQAQPASAQTSDNSLASLYRQLHGRDFQSSGGPFSQQHHFLHQQAHHHHQQQQQQQQQQHEQQQTHHIHPHHHHHHYQQQQDNSSHNQLVPSTLIHSPAPMRHNPPSNPTYPPETPPHMMPHQLNPSSSPSSGVGGMGSSTAMVLSRSDPVKRKRGRPRKYTTDASGIPIPSSSTSAKAKNVGRGPTKRKQLSTGAGHGFTPHVLLVAAGEDVTAKIMSLCQHGPWALCMLSANGAISTASLRHAGISSGAVTYEGRFEVLSLSGLFILSESGGMQSRSGGLSVSLAGQDGHVIGGKVAGPLIASSPVQVVVGTFFPHARKGQSAAAAQAPAPAHTQVGSVEPDIKGYIPAGVDDEVAGQERSSLPVVEEGQGAQEVSDIFQSSGSMQERSSDSAVAVVDREEHVAHHHHQHLYQGSHVMPLQSADWAGCHFNLETSGRPQ